ncbi:MAG: sugar ABC transporter permease [Thermosipho sp. (in: Bacteria)]|nr:sugar ABC transporter permease [Thermosipho sp. (in: thermotogales)]
MKKLRLSTKETITGLIFISPWLIGFLTFTVYPLIQSLWFSFNNVRPTAEGLMITFVGFDNYKNLFLGDVTFSDILINYSLQIIVYVPVIIVFSLFVALLLNQKIKGQSFFRTVFFLPVIITSGAIMKSLLEQGATTFEGLTKIASNPILRENLPPVLFSLLEFLLNSFIMILWFSGVQILIFLAGLQKLDKSMYEAARIDGASNWQLLWKLTLPILAPLITVNIIYTVVTVSTYSINPVIDKIQTDMYRPELGLGYAAAESWIYFGVIVLIIMVMLLLNIKRKSRAY